MYIKLFENHTIKSTILEDGEGGMCGDGGAMEDMGGATNASSSGQFVQPLFKDIVRKKMPSEVRENKKMKRPIGRLTMYITEDQMNELAKLLKEDEFGGGALTTNNIGVDGSPNNWTYDVPFGAKGKNDPAMDHKNILSRKSKANQPVGHIGESKSSIHIDPENKGKFTATKERTGKSTEELTHSKNPLTRKRANFARMAKRGWKPLKNKD